MSRVGQWKMDLEEQKNTCPECGKQMRVFYTANESDDYCKNWVCDMCGFEGSE